MEDKVNGMRLGQHLFSDDNLLLFSANMVDCDEFSAGNFVLYVRETIGIGSGPGRIMRLE
jgi:hypothetical protein